MSGDIYTAKAIRQAVHVLGYWIMAAAIVISILMPISAVVTIRITAKMAAESLEQRFRHAPPIPLR